ncbi:MAG: hypothetical protein ACREU2_11565 [Steroidobacteraceae bacterium]
MVKRQSATPIELLNDVDTRVRRARAVLDMIFVLAGQEEDGLEALRKHTLVTAADGAIDELEEVEELLDSMRPAIRAERQGKQA